MEFQKLQVEIRKGSGKGAARKLRAAGRAPGVLYGHGIASTTSVSLDPKSLRKALTTPFGLNTVLRLEIAGPGTSSEVLAMVQDRQTNPITGELLHTDFLTVDPARPVDVRVPVLTTGRCPGVAAGGRMLNVFREVPIRCLPDAIPTSIEVEVSALEIGMSVKVGQLPLPAGVLVMLDPAQAVIAVVAPEAEPKAEEAAAVVEGAEAVPAEGAAAAKPGEAKPADAKAGEAKPGADGKPAAVADAKAPGAKAAGKEKPKGREKK